MSRSAFLPEPAVLGPLLERVRAPLDLAAVRGHGAAASLPGIRPAGGVAPLAALAAELERTGSLDARFALFATWVQEHTGATAVFVADAEGLSMLPSGTGDGYVAAAGELGSVLEQVTKLLPDVEHGSTVLRSRTLGCVELVWCRTHLGRFTAGLVLAEPLRAPVVSLVRAALHEVAAAVR